VIALVVTAELSVDFQVAVFVEIDEADAVAFVAGAGEVGERGVVDEGAVAVISKDRGGPEGGLDIGGARGLKGPSRRNKRQTGGRR